SAARLGLGRLYLGQPMVAGHSESKPPPGRIVGDASADAWLDAWNAAHPGEQPVAPFASNLVFVDESGDRARELARTYTAKTFAAAVKNYEMTSEHHGTIKGYESYSSLRMTPEQAQVAIENAYKGSIAGTPREVLEQLEEVKRLRRPQGLIPHLYTGGMPHDECMRSIRLFASQCLDEMKSWSAEPSTIDGPIARAA
ncbi:MAG: LLM class flavin-dependent oxidoreductase, partial [Steroidobacteraceae bacterium]